MILNSPYISGSLTVTGNTVLSGSVTLAAGTSLAGTASLATSASFAVQAQTASFVANAQSASNAVTAQTASFANTFTVNSTLTAQTLVVQTITSSVDYVTGSTRFGSLLTNTHVFSGSVTMNPGGLFVSSSGLVGIGTTTPSYTLDIVGTSRINVTRSNGTNTNALILSDNLTGVSTASFGTRIVGYSNNNGVMSAIGFENGGTGTNNESQISLYTQNVAGALTRQVVITSTGNVGIGTSTPSNIVHAYSTLPRIIADTNTRYAVFNTYVNGVEKGAFYWDNTDNVIRVQSSASIALCYNGSPTSYAMYINPTGNIGIGTTSPASGRKLDVNGAIRANAYDAYYNSATSGYLLTEVQWTGVSGANNLSIAAEGGVSGGGNITFFTSGSATEKMRLTSGGTLSIGTSSAPVDASTQKLQIYGAIRQDVRGTSYGEGMIMNFPSDGTNYGGLFFHQTSTAMAAVGAGSIKWGLNYNYMPEVGTGAGYIAFVSANTNTRMAITTAGAVLINNTSPVSGRISAATLQVTNEVYSRGSSAGFFWEDRTNSANWYGWYATGTMIYLYNGSSSAASINPSTGAYTALSDINKKKDFEASTIGLDAVMNLKPTLYRMKTDDETSDKHLGFIAQEVKDYIPQAYVEHGEGDEKFIGLSDRPIIAALTKAIQELKAEVDELKNK